MLYIVATPIGNLKDITLRALDVLREVDVIVAEDTRHTRKLLSHYDIHKQLISLHEHSPRNAFNGVIKLLQEEKNIAYVVDAGTPGIADPGAYLVSRVSQELPEVTIMPVPGASALAAAISIAGLKDSKFTFLGFPPVKQGRAAFFAEVIASPYPVVLYESPHRILKTLTELSDNGLSMFDATLIKEISKVYETTTRMNIVSLKNLLAGEKKIKGEFVLIINK